MKLFMKQDSQMYYTRCISQKESSTHKEVRRRLVKTDKKLSHLLLALNNLTFF